MLAASCWLNVLSLAELRELPVAAALVKHSRGEVGDGVAGAATYSATIP